MAADYPLGAGSAADYYADAADMAPGVSSDSDLSKMMEEQMEMLTHGCKLYPIVSPVLRGEGLGMVWVVGNLFFSSFFRFLFHSAEQSTFPILKCTVPSRDPIGWSTKNSNPVMTFSASPVPRVVQTTGSVHPKQPTLSNC